MGATDPKNVRAPAAAGAGAQSEGYEAGMFEKIINYALCRTDLAKRKMPMKPVSLVQLFRYGTRVDTILIFLGVIGAIVSGAGQPFVAVAAGGMVNVFLVQNDTQSQEFRDGTYKYVYYYLGIGAGLMIIAFLQACFWHVTCTRIVNRIRRAFLKSLLRQDAAWFDNNHSGALTTRLNDNIDRIQEGIGDKLGLLLRGISQFVGGLVISFVYNWQMTLVMVVIAPLVAITMSVMSRRMSTAMQKEMAVYAKAGAVAEEAISGVKTVAAFNAQDHEVKRYETELNGGKKNGIMKGVWSGVLEWLFSVIVFTFFGVAIYYGAYLYSVDVITNPGDVFVVLIAMLQGAFNLGMVSPHLMVLLGARVAAATVYATIDRTPPIDAYSTEGKKLDNTKGKIEFRDVHFRYPSRPEAKVLQGATFTVEPGQTVALVGHSGCGKSTSVGLLTRLYEAESGSVTIDGHEVTSLNINWLRNTVGIVQQEPILFNGSVEENIKIGKPDMTQEEVVRVCRMANAHDFIRKLAYGYKTRLGEGGVQLSGGQKQRIAIARTLAKDPKILLLDEATSALDAQSESVVQTALDRASKGRSTIVIAHRLSTVRDASKIVVLDKGCVVEEGTHHQLLALNGHYASLVRAQQFQRDDQTILEEVELNEDDVNEDDVPPVPRSRITSVTSAMSRQTQLRDSLRRSYRREFSQSSHKGDAEQEQLEEELQEEGGERSSWMDIVRSTRKEWPLIAVAVLFSVVRGLVFPAFSLLYGYVFDIFNGPRDELRHGAVIAMVVYIAIGIANGFAALFSVSLFGLVGENLTMQFRLTAFENILRQDAAYFDNPAHTSGKIISRLASDAPNIKAAIDSRFAQVMQGFISMLAGIILGFIYGWRLAFVGTALFVALGFMQFFLARKVQEMKKKLADIDEAGRVAIEAIENVQTVQLLTREKFFYQKFVDASSKQHKAELYKGPIAALQFAVAQSLQYFIQALCYWAGVSFIIQGYMTPRDVYQVIQSLALSSLGIMNAANFFPEFVKARTAAGLLFKMIRQQPRTGDARKGDRPNITGEITFNSVFFAYPVRAKYPVLNGLSFTAGKGKTVALVGPSGSGKSTVISMLERFYDPLDGAVKFDGNDLKGMSLEHVRESMALVGQEPRLFSGSIRENIAYGMGKDVPMEKVEQAAQLANAAKFIAGLPDGYDTLVGEKGTQLSGGQKQRIAIARAMIRDPKILLLDEATSALDSESERAVQEALDRAREGRTCITIAHRLSSIQNSDLIIVVDGGKVVEYGNHQELQAMRGAYYELTRKQDLSGDLKDAE